MKETREFVNTNTCVQSHGGQEDNGIDLDRKTHLVTELYPKSEARTK